MGADCMRSLKSERTDSEIPVMKKKPRSKYNLTIEQTGVSEVDSLFGTAKDLLLELMDERKDLHLVYKKLQKATCVNMLQTPILEDVVVAMLYIYSAGAEGNLSKYGLELSEDSPYITVDESCIRNEHREIEQQWKAFIQELNTVLPTMERLQRDISDEVDKTAKATEITQAAIEGLELEDQIKINNIVRQNLDRLYLAPRMIAEVLEMHNVFAKELNLLVVTKLKQGSLLKHIDTVGTEASRARIYEPKKVVMTYWPDEHRIIAR